MQKTPIKINQIWRNKRSTLQILIAGKARESHKWKAKVLTEKPDVYAGSHTMSHWTIWKKFELVQ